MIMKIQKTLLGQKDLCDKGILKSASSPFTQVFLASGLIKIILRSITAGNPCDQMTGFVAFSSASGKFF